MKGVRLAGTPQTFAGTTSDRRFPRSTQISGNFLKNPIWEIILESASSADNQVRTVFFPNGAGNRRDLARSREAAKEANTIWLQTAAP